MKPVIDINEVSKISGITASAIRFYEEKGLIRSIGRKGLRRLFASNIFEKLAVISLAQNAGFSLSEIGSMVTSQNTKIDRELLNAKADELDQKIRTMTTMRNGLRHAAACKASNHFECPKFLRLLRISGKKRIIRRLGS
jgi:DNA-binding transcriptional MerR regulator